jgi:hypothetical protein
MLTRSPHASQTTAADSADTQRKESLISIFCIEDTAAAEADPGMCLG